MCAVRGLFTHVVDSNLHCEVGGDSQSVPTPSFVSSFQSFWKRLPRESRCQFGRQTPNSDGFHPVFLSSPISLTVLLFNSEALNSWIFIAVFKKAVLILSGSATESQMWKWELFNYIQLFGALMFLIVRCCLFDDVFTIGYIPISSFLLVLFGYALFVPFPWITGLDRWLLARVSLDCQSGSRCGHSADVGGWNSWRVQQRDKKENHGQLVIFELVFIMIIVLRFPWN